MQSERKRAKPITARRSYKSEASLFGCALLDRLRVLHLRLSRSLHQTAKVAKVFAWDRKTVRYWKPLTTSSGHSGSRQSPVCDSAIEPLGNGWRRTERRYCSDRCRMNAWIIPRAANLLMHLPAGRLLDVLKNGAKRRRLPQST